MPKELTISDDFDISALMTPLLMLVMIAAITSLASTTAAHVAAASYKGLTDHKEVDVPSNKRVWLDLLRNPPFNPYTLAVFRNNGPDPVEIGINSPDGRFTIVSGSVATVDRQGPTEKRISIIFLYCQPGETAQVEIDSEY